MSYTPPSGNQVALPIGGGLAYSPAAGNQVPLPLEDDHPAPNAVADAYSIALNTARTVAAPGVLANDAAYSGVLYSHTSPAHGVLILNSDGSFTYTPTGSYIGADSFTYTLANDNGFGTATVSLTIFAPPVAIGHAYDVLWNAAATIAAPGVLNGCTINGATITGHTTPAHGTLVLAADGSFTYTPTTGYTGPDSFDFTLGNYAGTSTATVTLTVRKPPSAISDSYATTQGVTLSVAAPGPLYNDDLEGATVTLGASPAHGALTFNPDGSFVYTPNTGYSGSDSFTYVLTNPVGTSTDTVNITVTALPPVHRYMQVGNTGAWSLPPRKRADVALPWSAPPRRRSDIAVPYVASPRQRMDIATPWQAVPRVPMGVQVPFALPPRRMADAALPWRRVPRQAASSAAAWSMPPRQRQEIASPFLAPPRRSAAVSNPFVVQQRHAHDASIPWLNPPRRQLRLWIPWDAGDRVAWQPPDSPGVDVPPVIVPPPWYTPPDGANVALPLECLWYDDPGNQIAIPIGPFACYASTLGRRRYVVLNTAAVVRLPERTTIPVSAITLTADVGSFAWSASLTLADPAFKSYLLPDSDGPRSVEININGYVWTAIIETWSTQTAFPGETITMSGHSRTMLLNAPYIAPRDYVQPVDRNAQQLMDDELQFSGFTVDYGTLDWLVPGGIWTYQQQTPVGAIMTIAAAAGAVVQSHPFEDVLQIRPRWPVSPWNWSMTSPDKMVLDDFTPEHVATDQTSGLASYEIHALPLWPATATDKPGLILPLQLVQFVAAAGWMGQVASVQIAAQRTKQSNGAEALVVTQDIKLDAPRADPIYDYVLVSGQQVGVADPIIRDGRSGTTRLRQIVDALIVTDQVALERGRNAIASGDNGISSTNFWRALTGVTGGSRYIKGNVTAINGDGSITVATSDGGTIRARPLPSQTWTVGNGVFVQDGRIVDVAPALPGVTQYV